jgi:hypothetical protein
MASTYSFRGSGDITRKIVATGPGDQPLTVAPGHASGRYSSEITVTCVGGLSSS